MKLKKYLEFIKEEVRISNVYIPTYEECVEICSQDESPFYETKLIVESYPVSLFNYRLAKYSDFVTPLPSKPSVSGKEMRGLSFVFNTDGTLYNRYVLLEKFFNLNQVPESMYSVIKNYKIKFVNNKEDGSIASFIKLPNGKVVGKSKMGFDNEQANGINYVYNNRPKIKKFVDWCLNNDIIPIFEYVSPANRIVLRYLDEDLILLRMRDNKTGKHIDLKNHMDKIGSIKIAPFEDDEKDLDKLIEVTATQVDKEGIIVQTEDSNGNDLFFKLKTPWYVARHNLLTNDLYRENILIGYILDDMIDDLLGQIPEDEKDTHERINKIINIVKKVLDQKVNDIKKLYQVFVSMNKDRKEFALKYFKDKNFSCVMSMNKGVEPYEIAKDWLRKETDRLFAARDFLQKIDSTIFFKDVPEDDN